MDKTIKKNIMLTCTFITLLISTTVFSAQLVSIDVGLKMGDKAPMITAVNTQGEKATIKELSLNKGLILVFNRSADWCPFCKRHLIELNQYADKFTELGYGVAALSYDSIDILKAYTKERKIKFPMLSDVKSETFLSYGILNKQYKPGDMDYGIPYPGVVVINEQGIMIHSYFFQGYKKRVKFEQLYQQLK
jgi:peroxiredoxin